MEKKARIEAVPVDVINHSGLANLHLFYDFVYIDGKSYFVRKNNLLAVFFPFIAKKLWYKPFQVSGEVFEIVKNKKTKPYSLGIVVGFAAVFGSYALGNPLNNTFPYNIVLFDFRSISNIPLKIVLTFLVLLFGFCMSIAIVNCLWRIVGYVIFKIQGFSSVSLDEPMRLRKIVYYDPRNIRGYFVWGGWGSCLLLLLVQSFIIQNSVLYPFFNVEYWVGLAVLLSFAPMILVPKEYQIINKK